MIMQSDNLTRETASQQKNNYNITPYELYQAGKYLLMDCIINIDVTRPEFHEGQHEHITKYNAKFEALSEQWEGIWAALKKRIDQLEDVSFMLGLMEDLYDEIIETARESQDVDLDFPTIRLGALMMKIYAKKDELENEDAFVNVSASKQDILKQAIIEAHNIIDTKFPVVYRGFPEPESPSIGGINIPRHWPSPGSSMGINAAEVVLEEAYKEIDILVAMTKRAIEEEV